jgi:hypothetical protein
MLDVGDAPGKANIAHGCPSNSTLFTNRDGAANGEIGPLNRVNAAIQCFVPPFFADSPRFGAPRRHDGLRCGWRRELSVVRRGGSVVDMPQPIRAVPTCASVASIVVVTSPRIRRCRGERRARLRETGGLDGGVESSSWPSAETLRWSDWRTAAWCRHPPSSAYAVIFVAPRSCARKQ